MLERARPAACVPSGVELVGLPEGCMPPPTAAPPGHLWRVSPRGLCPGVRRARCDLRAEGRPAHGPGRRPAATRHRTARRHQPQTTTSSCPDTTQGRAPWSGRRSAPSLCTGERSASPKVIAESALARREGPGGRLPESPTSDWPRSSRMKSAQSARRPRCASPTSRWLSLSERHRRVPAPPLVDGASVVTVARVGPDPRAKAWSRRRPPGGGRRLPGRSP